MNFRLAAGETERPALAALVVASTRVGEQVYLVPPAGADETARAEAQRDALAALRAVGADMDAHDAGLATTAVALAAWALAVEPTAAGVMVAAAALPVAGNVYILAHHFGVAQERVSAAILISTTISIATVPYVIHLIPKG